MNLVSLSLQLSELFAVRMLELVGRPTTRHTLPGIQPVK